MPHTTEELTEGVSQGLVEEIKKLHAEIDTYGKNSIILANGVDHAITNDDIAKIYIDSLKLVIMKFSANSNS